MWRWTAAFWPSERQGARGGRRRQTPRTSAAVITATELSCTTPFTEPSPKQPGKPVTALRHQSDIWPYAGINRAVSGRLRGASHDRRQRQVRRMAGASARPSVLRGSSWRPMAGTLLAYGSASSCSSVRRSLTLCELMVPNRGPGRDPFPGGSLRVHRLPGVSGPVRGDRRFCFVREVAGGLRVPVG